MSSLRSETCARVALALALAACRGDGGRSTATGYLARLQPLAASGPKTAEARP
jgi:hypothetical protein